MRELQLACGPPAGPGAGGQGGARVAPAWGAAAGLGAGALVSGHGVAAPTCSAGSGLAHTCPLAPSILICLSQECNSQLFFKRLLLSSLFDLICRHKFNIKIEN